MVIGKNMALCIAEDIVRNIYNLLNEAEKPPGYENLTLLVSPEIPIAAEEDLPAICIDVQSGDRPVPPDDPKKPDTNNGKVILVQSIISLNIRVNLADTDNVDNGIAAVSPLHRWCMRLIMNDAMTKAMSFRPIKPQGWGQLYGDTHEIPGKGVIQLIEFTHLLNRENAWN
jgi:hypothetical protein